MILGLFVLFGSEKTMRGKAIAIAPPATQRRKRLLLAIYVVLTIHVLYSLTISGTIRPVETSDDDTK
jgi:hypothetical protein